MWVADTGNNRVQRFTAEGGYLSQFGTIGNGNGRFSEPKGVAISSSGNVWVADTLNSRADSWTPEHRFAHDTQTIYYTPGAEARVTACQNHPEWANLACRIEPAAQPTDVNLGEPKLPVITMSYNIWDEVNTTTETFGSLTRTKTQVYDSAGRAFSSEETSTNDNALPKVTDKYNSETGALETESATIKGETKTNTTKENTLGEVTDS